MSFWTMPHEDRVAWFSREIADHSRRIIAWRATGRHTEAWLAQEEAHVQELRDMLAAIKRDPGWRPSVTRRDR